MYCISCGLTYRETRGLFVCDLCEEAKANRKIFGVDISDRKLLSRIKENDKLIEEIKEFLGDK